MTRDYMDRPMELILLDKYLAAIIESISNLLDENLTAMLAAAFIGTINADEIAKVHSIMAASEKQAALYIISRAEDLDLISYDDWYRIYGIIGNMDVGDTEDFKSWN